MSTITYERLFVFLDSLNFTEVSVNEFERVFSRDNVGVIVAFSMLDDPSPSRLVREADLLSVEYRLIHHGLIGEDGLKEAIRMHNAQDQSN